MSQQRWFIFHLLSLLAVLSFFPVQYAAAEAGATAEATNPRADYWREVRGGTEGYTAIKDHPAGGVFIQSSGQNWRQLRNGPIATYGAWLLLGVIAAIGLFFLVRGRIRLEEARTGVLVPRWNVFERFIHWFVTILFLVLALSGLSLLFGKYALIPLFGKESFAAYAGLAKTWHNYLGPFFTGGLVIMLLMWLWDNIPSKVDIQWFLKGGGIIGNGHPSSGRVNAGEKMWYWAIFFIGGVVCAAGLFMSYPIFGQTRGELQLAHLLHASLSIIWIAFAIGHIYIATIGSEGSLEGMITGYVDETWAKQHHDLWFDEMQAKQNRPQSVLPQATPKESH